MRNHKVYLLGLIDPVTLRLAGWYVGSTEQPITRLRAHLRNSHNEGVRLLLAADYLPDITWLSVGWTAEEARAEEMRLINGGLDLPAELCLNIVGANAGGKYLQPHLLDTAGAPLGLYAVEPSVRETRLPETLYRLKRNELIIKARQSVDAWMEWAADAEQIADAGQETYEQALVSIAEGGYTRTTAKRMETQARLELERKQRTADRMLEGAEVAARRLARLESGAG